ncbi:DUF5682 family protein [Nocardiopsis sediminis]|uniref:DUF5682 family protein n=1 Tax=Nocardiopsis sediminis TaxID=1778267 RepID=A0ABV8FMR6_9ACTN
MGRRVDTGRVHVLGVRHHGPGSARAVRAALEGLRPDAVLIEGPPEADALTRLVPELKPPVALLAYTPGDTARAAFWPFAEFSPEWVALDYAARAGADVRFCDLPAALSLAEAAPGPGTAPEEGGPGGAPAGGDGPGVAERSRVDPLGVLAEAAGYDDPERWWDDVIEQRPGPGADDGVPSPFPAIAEAMTAVRAELAPEPADPREARREAHMRRVLRSALRAGYQRIAVVCGAWHVPALLEHPRVADDDALLRGRPKVKVAATWIPWTHGRLAAGAGYLAGVRSPGWYHHLFTVADRPVERWLTEAARLLREKGQPVSSAHVIEAVRLTGALAALRGRPLAGLAELAEATSAVLCEGSVERADLVHGEMALGERMGAVPDSTPMVPLQRDLAACQRRLRLTPGPAPRDLDLDLREESARTRSALLHRLRLIGVAWGEPRRDPTRSQGTFRETWTLAWAPELDLALIEAGRWGTTVAGAAAARARDIAARAPLPELTGLTEACLKAGLDDAVDDVLARLADRAAEDDDIEHLMDAVPPLARSARYGDVRRTGSAALRRVAGQLMARVCAGLGPALSGLGDDAATRMVTAIDEVHGAAVLLGGACQDDWLDALASVAVREDVPGRVCGRAHRILYESGRIGGATTAVRLGLATSRATPPERAAAWIEGFLSGGGLLLIHDEALLALVDAWLADLAPQAFVDVLPLLRRTFGAFAAPERRAIGERARHLGTGASATAKATASTAVDSGRAAPAVATAALVLGAAPAAPMDPSRRAAERVKAAPRGRRPSGFPAKGTE